MIRIDRKKLVNRFKISFCVKRLVSEIKRVKVGNFGKKSRTLGNWIRGKLVFQLLEKNITVRLILLKQTEKMLTKSQK